MILIIAGSYNQAKKWAASQQLASDEWFSTLDEDEIKRASNFHVVILESAAELPPMFFERIYTVARTRGRIDRK